MKKPTCSNYVFAITLLLLSVQLFSQNLVPFNPRYDEAIKGDILLIGNSNVGIHASDPYNGTDTNDRLDSAVFVDIDGDSSTFNSSSADLDVPNDVTCYRIVYAGLYWSAVVDGDTPISDIKFKTPGGSYVDISGTEIYFQDATTDRYSNTYAYYHDVTDMLTALPDPEGTYSVANISSMVGLKPNSEGLSAGWSLFVVYEDPLLPSKYITSFDGFTKITSTINETIPVSGFETIPIGPVRAKYAFSTIEGDRRWTGDYLLLNGTAISATNNAGTVIREDDNFFNSTSSIIDPVTNTPEIMNTRLPDGSNTLGFDSGIINIPNAGNTLIPNGATSATISLGSNLDIYYFYFNAFAIEIIAPNIVLTKIVEDELGNDIGGQIVDLGDQLYYTIGFQNTGNDDATDLTIRDIIPTNIVFNYPADIEFLPPGVTVQSYNAVTRELIFRVDRDVVEENDPVSSIRFKVTVVSTCSLLSDACSNNIDNQAYATYKGTVNPDFVISDDPSFNTNSGCLLTPGATNFLADIYDCTFEEDVILCGASVQLTAGNGYDKYSWSTSPSGVPVIGTSQTISVTSTGPYYVHNTAVAPCQDTDQIFNVVTFGENVTNPVIPFADEVVICPNDGKELPNIFLCGINGSKLIQTNISDTASMIWEKLDESSCDAVVDQDCANEDGSCTWNQVTTGPDFIADTAGQYRLTMNYSGGCFNQFYFNIYTNLLVPTVNSRDIYCTTPGEIVVGGVPSGYEYSIDAVNYQTSNTFSITTANLYTIYLRQIGVTPNPCIFAVPDVQIVDHDFSVSSIITQPFCYGELGSVAIAANDARPQYYFSISQGGTLVNSVGPIAQNNYTFSNLNTGIYTIDVSTEDGCVYSGDIEIVEPELLEATSALTTPLTCTDGEITVYPVGGTPPYYYFVNSTTVFQSTPIITVTSAGNYNITVVDSNNCTADTSITVDQFIEPDFNIVKTDILCSDNFDSGIIEINVTNPNGNSLAYSIDNGVTFVNSSIFSGLPAGDYNVIVQYGAGTDVCITAPQTISIISADSINGTAMVTAPFTCVTNGVITVSGVTGGTAPYMYSIDGVNFQNNLTFSGLTDGLYMVSIRDASNCVFIAEPVTIDSLNPPTDLSFINTPLSCPLNVSDVTVTASGGFGTLTYEIIAPTSATSNISGAANGIFTGLAPNTYTFQVTDANDCTYIESYAIAPLPPVTFNTVLTKDLDCTVTPDAVITGSITGGAAPFTYTVSFNGGSYGTPVPASSSFTYVTQNPGTYQIQITDANGCTAESGLQFINIVSPPEISLIPTRLNLCHGDNIAAFDITINNTVGTPPFLINVVNTTTGSNFGAQTSGLPAGNYEVTIIDSKSCTDTKSIVINEPTPINVTNSTVPITCGALGVSKGSVIIDGVSGGTAPYNYYVTGSNGYSDSELNASGTTSTTFDVVDFGLYQINVIDSNGCSVLVQDVLVASPPDDLDINISVLSDCLTGGEVAVTVNSALTGSGPFYFDIYKGTVPSSPPGGTWVAEDAPGSATFSGLTPGVVYTFIVYDSLTQCSYYETATAPIPTNSTLTATALTSNNITCLGSADGNVSFTVNSLYGSATNIDYEVWDALASNPTGISGSGTVPANGSISVNDLGSLPYGNYFVVIQETSGPNSGCGVVSTPFNITESARELSITATIDKTANCNPNSGVISANATDGTSPYVYQLNTTATPPLATDALWASTNVFNVDAGNYYVHVQDAYGCIRTIPAALTVSQDPEPVITATVNNQCTIAEGNFAIDVALTVPGITPYSFSVDGGAFQTRTAPFTVNNLTSGTHTVEIQDSNGCGNLVTVEVQAPIELTPSITALPTCNDNDGQITITGTGGTGSYTYAISPSPVSATLNVNEYSGLPSGQYTLTITDAVTLCSKETTIFLSTPSNPVISTTSTPLTCISDNSGTIDINVNGYSGPYTYELFDGSGTSVSTGSGNTSLNPQQVTSLLAGDYSVVITETASPFCSATSNVIVASPAEALTLVAVETSNVTCDNNQGTIMASANGGWGNYQYELTGAAAVTFSSNGTFTNLAAGNYTVNVIDDGGCIASDSVILVLPTIIDGTITASANTLACYGDTTASISVNTVTGGQGSNYTYTLNQLLPIASSSGPQTVPVFDGLGAGTYMVLIADGYNCDFETTSLTISEPTQIESVLVKESSQTCITNSTLRLSATGGVGPYTFSDSPSFTTVLGSFTSSISLTVSDGTFRYFVRDANGCVSVSSNEITIDPLPDLSISIDATNASINCAGDSSGVIIAEAQGGLGNYMYTLQDTSGTAIMPEPVQDMPGVFTDLPAGTYQVSVSSGLDCNEVSAQISITEPTAPLVANYTVNDVTCNGGDDGIMEIMASGGTGIIKYAIFPQLNQFFEAPVFKDLMAGNYQAIAQDELGCFVIFDFTIKEPSPVILSIVPNSMVSEICSGDLDGAFSIDISGGTLPYSVTLDDISGTYTTGSLTQTTFDFENLDGGDHIVYVRDLEGCESEWNITFPESVIIDPQVTVEYGCVDNIISNSVTVTIDPSISNSSDIDYSLNNGPYQTSNVFTNITSGIGHSITVRHTNGCEKSTLNFDINEVEPLQLILEDGELNEIVALTSGGTAPYEYTLNGESYGEKNTFIIYASGDYTVTVTDRNGCVASATRYFEFIDICIPNYFTANNGDGWGPGCASQYRELTFDIFDRYGRKLATLNVDEKWKGTYKGAELPSGDYWYVVKLNDAKDKRDFVGHFTLYR